MTMRTGTSKFPFADWADEAGRATVFATAGGAVLLLAMIRSPRTALASATAGALIYAGVRGLLEQERGLRSPSVAAGPRSKHNGGTQREAVRPDRPSPVPEDRVDEASWESFPASDAPSWSAPSHE